VIVIQARGSPAEEEEKYCDEKKEKNTKKEINTKQV
jgi:hypothetical protein